ncbi:ABC transporter permease [Bosea sp. LjRoot90]|uniref:ABC transporter permease n=1 Tax=Bosea sp. LjRoot90 TaxID=3342342 RepID=UPI003ED09945
MTPRGLPHRLLSAALPIAVIAAWLLAWEGASRMEWLNTFRFPPPSRVWESAVDLATNGFPMGTRLGSHIAATLQRVVCGYLLALALAIPLGLAIGRNPVADRMTAPIIAFCRSVATLSLLPLALVWFGTGEASKIFLIGYGCFWVMLSAAVAAAKLIDPVLIRAARTLDTSRRDLFLRVSLPATLPRLFSGARIALGVGFMVIVGAEMIGTTTGLGALIMEARTFYRSDLTVVGMALIGLIGFGLTAGLAWLEARLMPWQEREASR